MEQYIPKSAVLAEIENLLDKGRYHEEYDCAYRDGNNGALYALKNKLNTFEVKEVEENKLSNPRFPHLDNIVDKVFGTGNLESWEYEEAEQLVLLAKEELLKDLEVKEVDLDFQRFAKEMKSVFSLPSSKTENTEEETLNWEYTIAKHFYSLGFKAQKGEITMATITEDYVSFETAKLLKEKGFKEITQGYINADQEVYMRPFQQGVYELRNKQYPYPTLQMAMKWLREVHNIVIVIEPHKYDYINEKNSSYIASLWQGDNYYEYITSKDYPTYEETADAAIKYCLENLIK